MYAEDGPVTTKFTKVSRALMRAGTRNCEVSVEGYKILGPEFFQCDALELAPKLLGEAPLHKLQRCVYFIYVNIMGQIYLFCYVLYVLVEEMNPGPALCWWVAYH